MLANQQTNLSVSHKNVLFMTAVADVSDWLYKVFSLPALKDQYNITASVATREAAVERATKDHIDLVIFFEKTPGNYTISETAYRLRLANCRIIFVTSERTPGDLVLEALVGYGVYDIIMNDSISAKYLVNIIDHPRDFCDVSIFHRFVAINDTGTGKRNFVIPKLDMLRQFSTTISEDYLSNPIERMVEKQPSHIDTTYDDQSVSNTLFKEKEYQPQKEKKPMLKQPPKKNPAANGYGDLIDIDF